MKTALKAFLLLMAGIGLPLVGLAVWWKSCDHTAMQGRVEVKGSVLGDWQAPLGRCAGVPGTYAPGAGEVELGRREDDGPLARFTMDPLDGAVVRLWAPSGERTLEVRGRECPALRASLARANAAGAAKARWDGSLSGACPLPGGGTVTIDVWFRDCP